MACFRQRRETGVFGEMKAYIQAFFECPYCEYVMRIHNDIMFCGNQNCEDYGNLWERPGIEIERLKKAPVTWEVKIEHDIYRNKYYVIIDDIEVYTTDSEREKDSFIKRLNLL